MEDGEDDSPQEHPCKEHRAFCAALLLMETEEAEKHLYHCFVAQGEAAYALARFYEEFRPKQLIQKLKLDVLTTNRFDFSGFKEITCEIKV